MTMKPISITNSIWYFVVSSALIWFGVYRGIPFLQTQGMPFFPAYLILFYIPFVLLLVTAIILYRTEGGKWNWSEFAQRTRLVKLTKTDWQWAIGSVILGAVIYAALVPVGAWFAKISFFSPPAFFPAEINPNKTRLPGFMMDYRLSGQYWVIPAYLVGWFFNIFGEELLWRGILLPRQIMKYGSKAWIYHGIIWTFWHFFGTWNLLSLLPLTMAIPYIAYKRQNTWIPIIAHGFLNFIPLIIIIIEVFN